MKHILAAALALTIAAPAFAGGMAAPVEATPTVMVEETSSSSSGILIPIILLVIVAAAVAASN
jgi:hypothetical protein